MATITTTGFDRVEESEVADRFRSLVDELSTAESTTGTGSAPSIAAGGAR